MAPVSVAVPLDFNSEMPISRTVQYKKVNTELRGSLYLFDMGPLDGAFISAVPQFLTVDCFFSLQR